MNYLVFLAAKIAYLPRRLSGESSCGPVCSPTIAIGYDPETPAPEASARAPYYGRQAGVHDVGLSTSVSVNS